MDHRIDEDNKDEVENEKNTCKIVSSFRSQKEQVRETCIPSVFKNRKNNDKNERTFRKIGRSGMRVLATQIGDAQMVDFMREQEIICLDAVYLLVNEVGLPLLLSPLSPNVIVQTAW
ncbi:hypothetical protein QJS10_CPB13g00564 [Acorus calamus]|uniref:Uncharacterized protein n=1 Tax=Acorus calamus TaxID=4465 RepID=A0AAV9DJF4_ACOCL|nr:hypothetical protein QJS10_CPB13g00564 [Acorus calamus]